MRIQIRIVQVATFEYFISSKNHQNSIDPKELKWKSYASRERKVSINKSTFTRVYDDFKGFKKCESRNLIF